MYLKNPHQAADFGAHQLSITARKSRLKPVHSMWSPSSPGLRNLLSAGVQLKRQKLQNMYTMRDLIHTKSGA